MKLTYFLFFLLFNLISYKVTADSLSTQIIIKKYADQNIIIQNTNYETVDKLLENTATVQLTNNQNKSLVGIPVYYQIINQPDKSEGFNISPLIVYTDSNGIAKTNIKLGNKEGSYQVIASVKENANQNFTVFNYFARKSNWLFLLIVGLIGGLGLFLLGVELMSIGLKKSVGSKIRTILSSLTKNRLKGTGVGIFITTITQSSSATSVMLISFVDSGLMSFKQTIGVIIGAALGTTITIQLVAFNITDYSLLMIAAGFSIQFLSKTTRLKNIGQTILGVGILFFGLYIMSNSIVPLKTYAPFANYLLKLENPAIAMLVGIIFTALTQSSSAFIGIMVILASQGLLSLEAGIPMLLGSNIGTSVTAIIASIHTSSEAKKVAIAHTVYRIVGALLIVWCIPTFADLVVLLSPKMSNNTDISSVVPRQIANAHTVFYVFYTLLALPFTNIFAKLIDRYSPFQKTTEKDEFETKYLDEKLIDTPALALNLAKQEIIRMARIVQIMVADILIPFIEKKDNLNNIQKKENQINFLHEEISQYLLKIGRGNIREERVQENFQMMYTIKELEQIADIVSTNLLGRAKNWIEKGYEFSEQGKEELKSYHLNSIKQISRAIEVFQDVNLEKAKHMKMKHKLYRSAEMELEYHHYERLISEIDKSVSSSKTHIELISMLKAINSHSTNIARIHLDWGGKIDEKSR